MSGHDPLCRQQHWEGGDCFDCRLITKVRADERAQHEGARVTFTVTADGLVAAIDDPLGVGWTRLALELIPQLVANDRDARRLADLRAKVEALLNEMHADWSNPRYQRVLDLIGGNK